MEFYKKPTLMGDFYRHEVGPIASWPSREHPEAMKKALDVAHDNLRKLIRVNDLLRKGILTLDKDVQRERLWRKGIFWSLLVAIFMMLLDMSLR